MSRAIAAQAVSPPHLAISGWTTDSTLSPSACAENWRGLRYFLLPRAARRCLCATGSADHFPPRPVGPDRFFEPCKTEFFQLRCDFERAGGRPSLIGICGQHAVADELAKRGEIGAIGGGIEADFQFQRTVAPTNRRFGHLPRTRRIDAAGIDTDLHCRCRRAVSTAASCDGGRRVSQTARSIPAIACAKGPGSPDCSASTDVACVRVSKTSERVSAAANPRYRRREHFIDEPGAVFGAGRRKIGPDFAPADMAVFVFDANEHRRPVQHPAERRYHRRRQRIAIAKRLDASDGQGLRCHDPAIRRAST